VANAVLLHETDVVAVAVGDIAAGDLVDITGAKTGLPKVKALEPIPRGHKIALVDLAAGSHVRKYGLSIGVTKSDVKKGGWIHSHNLASGLHGTIEYKEPAQEYVWADLPARQALLNDPKSAIPKTFSGYRRPDGTVAIRNEIWIIPTVGCVNKTAENLADWARRNLGVDAWAYTHPFGCSQLGDDLENTRQILARLAKHPNAAGTLVVSLGCENLRLPLFQKALGEIDADRIKFLPMQEVADEVTEGHRLLAELADFASTQKREDIPISELVIGLKCGGSDGFSGLSANPLVGRVTDLLVAAGASAIQTEVPEMFGAETELMARSAGLRVFQKQVGMINGFKEYFLSHGQEVYENPSPGNKDGGITTLEEKSLGCIRKGGTAPIADVKKYAELRTEKGLTLVSGPGNDLVSTTNLTAAGSHVILFTTGRGTPFGAPAPTLKIATNSPLATKKPGWIDYDAGALLEGKSFDAAAVELIHLILATAEGQPTKAEVSGHRDIAIFKDGVIL
jgi:altronate hydrolase